MVNSVHNCRLPSKQNAEFSGHAINRGRPLKFHLDGRLIHGLEGDTVLSAVLANGIHTLGIRNDEPIALSNKFCPYVFLRKPTDVNAMFPMERMPAVNGLHLSLYKPCDTKEHQKISLSKAMFSSLFGKSNLSLDYGLDEKHSSIRPWIDREISEKQAFDMVVVGGGIAGMSAALAGIGEGLRVALIERQLSVGGEARFFGATEGEQRPELVIAQLLEELSNSSLSSIFLNAETVSIGNRQIRVQIIDVVDGIPRSKIVDFSTDKIVLATGMFERLPLFSGNRMPGVIGASTAFELATKYGIWPGKTAALSTVSSAATRVALFAADMGIEVKKLADSRINPKSRFFEFAKAYGISLATGTHVYGLKREKNKALDVQFGLSGGQNKQTGEVLNVDRLIVCGGWQPDLTLWHSLGGHTIWDGQYQQLRANGKIRNVQLAGTCLGTMNMGECKASGENAVHNLLGKRASNTPGALIQNSYESADGSLPISELYDEGTNCYLDTGYSLVQRKPHPVTSFWRNVFLPNKSKTLDLNEAYGETSINDVAARVMLSEIPAEFAGILAKERCGVVNELQQSGGDEEETDPAWIATKGLPPPYLLGRFGKKANCIRLSMAANSPVDIGCLIFTDHDNFSPAGAVGAIYEIEKADRSTVLAYVASSACRDGSYLTVRNGTQATSALVVEIL